MKYILTTKKTVDQASKDLEEAELNEVDRKLLWRRQFLNPFSIEP